VAGGAAVGSWRSGCHLEVEMRESFLCDEKVERLMCEKGMKRVNGFVVDIGEAAISRFSLPWSGASCWITDSS
jgi:hypothetical protein